MKKILSVFLTVCLIITVCPLGLFSITVNAATSGYYTYIVSNGEATITSVDESIRGYVTVPSTLGGYSVTEIAAYAFYACDEMTDVKIPNSVTTIGASAFRNCSGLESITLPFVGSELNDAYYTFFGYIFGMSNYSYSGVNYIPSKLKYVRITKATSIGDSAFRNCGGIERITLPATVTSIGNSAFEDCSKLTSVAITGRVNSIGEYAFAYCSNLTEINIPSTVTSIGKHAFVYCSNLTKINIPSTVTSIGEYAFSSCSSLTSINVEENNTTYSSIDGILFNIDKTILILYPSNKGSALYAIPDSVTSISDRAFSGCKSLTSIVIPNNVTSIGDRAFLGCGNIKDVWYKGSEYDQKNISILAYNYALNDATWHYNFCENDHIYSSDCDNQCNSCLWQRVAIGEHNYMSPCHDCCDDCGYLRTPPHCYQWVVDKESTCVSDGIKHQECIECNTKRYEDTIIFATGKHTYSEWEIDTEPTCTENGISYRTCNICGIKEEQDIIAKGHTYGEWVIERKPTCAKAGIEVKNCLICGDRQEQSVPIIDHNFNVYLDVNFPDCTQDGRRVIKCSGCSEQKIIETTGNHIYKNGKCTSCDIAEEIIESEHNYAKNSDYTWTVTKENAAQIDVKFSDQTVTEANYDFIYIYDGSNNLIGKYSGTQLAGQTVTVSGDTVKIRLKSDSSVQKYGFRATITPESEIIAGDTNGDGAVNALDVLNIQDAILMGVQTLTYDINGDGLVNLIDLVRIKKILAGKA